MEYSELPQHTKEDILRKSFDPMTIITETWGAEQGMELWEGIANSLGPEIKGDLFFAMLTGKGIGPLKLISINVNNCVLIIKSIRTHTGLGLREAKDIYDHVRDKGTANIDVSDECKSKLKQELLALGCQVR